MEEQMQLFRQICQVPVLLSILIMIENVGSVCLPKDRFELYDRAMTLVLQQRFPNAEAHIVLGLLRRMATANMLAGRRSFSCAHTRQAIGEDIGCWERLGRDEGIPFVKILSSAVGEE